MNVPGHLAVGYLAAVWAEGRAAPNDGRHLPALGRVVAPVLLGVLTPDLIDKSLLLAGVYRHGRTIGHSFLFLAVVVALWGLLRRGWGRGHLVGLWALGIASHFVADLADDFVRGLTSGGIMLSSWFAWPWATPSTWDYRPPFALLEGYRGTTPLEWLVILLAVVTALRLYLGHLSKD